MLRTDKMDVVIPGDVVAKKDERLPGEGVYEDGDVLRSKYVGKIQDDGTVVRVKPFNRPPVPRIGSIVVGYVLSIIRGRILQIQVYNLDGRIVQPFTVIAKIPDEEIPLADSYARVGDFVRAKIIDDKKLVATLEGEDLGVILAMCSRCNYPMLLEGEPGAGIKKLKCPICGNEETRKVAKDYNVFAKLALEKSKEYVILDTYRQIPFEMRS